MTWLIVLIVVVVLVGVVFGLRKTFGREIDRYQQIRRANRGE
ncbi:hypothetical protein [Psychromicrobium xiongbiense]|nr:hypothetical protein [Psychromicrobium sp. YIM S02556]